MNAHAKMDGSIAILIKKDPDLPALIATGAETIAIRAGIVFAGQRFAKQTPVEFASPLVVGADYGVVVSGGVARALRAFAVPSSDDVIGGFHFASGGNATARAGGDDIPAINPCSLWDLNFRPACPDPRGMALVQKPGGQFWCDVYLTGATCHLDGTSKFGVTIADGNDRPLDPSTGQPYARFDYATAAAVMAQHGKGLLGLDEFPAAAFGVTEKSSAKRDPKLTGLDAPRTSKFGLMQATGNLWVWGHDGDPDTPRASLFGGYWWYGDDAGSRRAYVACVFPGDSHEDFGARGRSDHLQPGRRRGSDGGLVRARAL
jgi:hypothetical protein